jgi:hypothetical protein
MGGGLKCSRRLGTSVVILLILRNFPELCIGANDCRPHGLMLVGALR